MSGLYQTTKSFLVQSLDALRASMNATMLEWWNLHALNTLFALLLTLFFYSTFLYARRFFLTHFLVRACRTTAVAKYVIERTYKCFIALVSVLLADLLFPFAPQLQSIIYPLITLSIGVQVVFWMRDLVWKMVDYHAENDGSDTSDLDNAKGFLRFVIGAAAWVAVTLLTLSNLGVNVTTLLAGMGVGGIAVGLAAQGIVSDMFAALSILLDQPFRTGDFISFGNVSGNVETIGLKTTRIRALSGEQIIVSNAHLLQQNVRNIERIEARRITLPFQVCLESPTDSLEALPRAFAKLFEGRRDCRLNYALLSGVGRGFFHFDLIFTVLSSDYDHMTIVRHDILIQARDLLKELNVKCIEPTAAVTA